MNYKNCSIYGLQSKKKLKELLGLNDNSYFKQASFYTKITPYIDVVNTKKRLLEKPSFDLKNAQRKLLHFLFQLDFPEYVFSGLKGKSYIDHARMHKGKKFVYKTDISKFFPSINRNKIYLFFKNKLMMSSDVAECLTNICTINYDMFLEHENYEIVNEYMQEYPCIVRQHLLTGSPVSCVLSYLANQEMFDKIYTVCKQNNITCTLYIDDMVFSSNKEIPSGIISFIKKSLTQNGYLLSERKINYYKPNMAKKITGVVINKDGYLRAPNSLIYKTHTRIKEYKNTDKNFNVNSLRGCIIAANSIDGRFSSVKRLILKRK